MSFRDDILSKTGAKKIVVSTDDTILEPAANNERYNNAVIDFITEENVQPLQVGSDVTVYFKASDNDQEMEISSIQKISDNAFRIKLDAGNGKEYTYVVDNNGYGEKIDISTYTTVQSSNVLTKNSSIFEKVPGALELSKAKADTYSTKQESVSQGQLSLPIISKIKETYTIEPADGTTENFTRTAPEKRTGYKISIAEHPNALFYLTLDENGWKVDNINSGAVVARASTAQATFELMQKNLKNLENVSLNNDRVVDIISLTGMNIEKLKPAEGELVKYTFFTLPFSKEEKESILANFTAKHFKGKNPSFAKAHIEEALAKATAEEQVEIIEKLKDCYR